jgi:tellurite resistance protein
MAYADGKFKAEEKELYKAVLSRLNLEDYEQDDFQRLLSKEENILEAMHDIEDISIKETLIKVMALMAIYDGELALKERDLLKRAANILEVSIDIDEVEEQSKEYKIIIEESIYQKSSGKIKNVTQFVGNSLSKTYTRFFSNKEDK